jgi:hypothetical protein
MAGATELPVLVEIRRAAAIGFGCGIEDRGTFRCRAACLPGGQSCPSADPGAHDDLPEGGFGWGLLRPCSPAT